VAAKQHARSASGPQPFCLFFHSSASRAAQHALAHFSTGTAATLRWLINRSTSGTGIIHPASASRSNGPSWWRPTSGRMCSTPSCSLRRPRASPRLPR
jgi:hypothetical protein